MITREEVLETAMEMVTGSRPDDYGTPENNFARIADLWRAYLGTKPAASINAADVAAMLALLKIARIASGHGKGDNWVDLAGYAACGGELQSAMGREAGGASQDGDGLTATPEEDEGEDYELQIKRMLDNSIQCLASVVKDATLNALRREGYVDDSGR